MVLPDSADGSTTTLELSRPETSFANPLFPPPRREVERYEKKILPPVPLKRESGVSNFSREMDAALFTPTTPKSASSPDEGSIHLIYHPSMSPRDAPDHEDGELVESLERQGDSKRLSEQLKLNTAGLSGAGPGSAVKPKVAKVLGVEGPRESTPTGHKLSEKVAKIMGIDLAYEGDRAQKQSPTAPVKPGNGNISPLSSNGSPYDFDSPRSAVSDLDSNAEALSRASPSEPSPTYFKFRGSRPPSTGTASSALPSLLNVSRPVAQQHMRSYERKPGGNSPRFRDDVNPRPAYNHRTLSDKSARDEYHAMHNQLARELAREARRVELSKVQLPVPQTGRDSSSDSHQKPKSKALALALRPRRHNQPHQPLFTSAGGDQGLDPIWRTPSDVQQGSPRVPSASTFGRRLTDRLHAQLHHHTSASSSPGPARQHSLFDLDSDSQHGIGTPDTGGSIPISLPASELGDTSASTPAPTHSLHTKAKTKTKTKIMPSFLRRLSASSPTTPRSHPRSPTTTTTAVPNNTPLTASFPPPRNYPYPHSPTSAYAHHHPPPLPSRSSSPFPSVIFGPASSVTTSVVSVNGSGSGSGSASPNPVPRTSRTGSAGAGAAAAAAAAARVKAKKSVTALAAKTTDFVGAAAVRLNERARAAGVGRGIGGGGEERRRERLKSSTRVLGDGGQVLGTDGGAGGSGSWSGSGQGGFGGDVNAGSVSVSCLGSEPGHGGLELESAPFRGRMGSAPAATATATTCGGAPYGYGYQTSTAWQGSARY